MARRALASRLRHRVDLVRPVRSAAGKGGHTTVLTPIASGVAAEVLSLTGSEAVQDKVLRGVRVYRITIRWRGDVLQSDQIAWAGDPKPLNVRSAVDPDNQRAELVIHADTDA